MSEFLLKLSFNLVLLVLHSRITSGITFCTKKNVPPMDWGHRCFSRTFLGYDYAQRETPHEIQKEILKPASHSLQLITRTWGGMYRNIDSTNQDGAIWVWRNIQLPVINKIWSVGLHIIEDNFWQFYRHLAGLLASGLLSCWLTGVLAYFIWIFTWLEYWLDL